MSCLYPPPYLFLLLFTHFLSPTIHVMFVCAKCWCLSYVFSAFGLFSYCLPGLFGSSPSQPVGCFLALLGCGMCLSVCLPSCHHCKLVNRSLSVLHASLFSPCGASPVTVLTGLFLFNLYFAFSAFCLHATESSPVTPFILVVQLNIKSGLKCAPSLCFT